EALHTAVFRVQQKQAAEEKRALEYSVLVVDDEKELCERIKRELDKEGYRTAVACDGVEGLDHFSHNRVDVAIVDIKMPRMSGLEMLEKCREITDDFVSIIITGHGGEERAIQALQLGVFNYLRKPVSLEGLVTSVGKGIELLHLRRSVAARRRELEIEAALKEQYAQNLERMVEERTKEIKKLSDAVKASTESIVISDLEGKIADVNEATLRMYGAGNKEDLVGKSSFDLIAPEDRQKAVAGMEEALEKGYIKDREYHVITNDGSRLPVEMSVSIMKGVAGEPIGFVGVTRDISERKRAEESIRSSLAEKELLLKEVHHRIKNNLAGIIGLLQLQRETVTDPAAVAQFRELEGRIRSIALVHETLYHIESLARVDLKAYLETLIAQLRAALAPHGDVRFSVAAAGVEMGLDNAVPCGLILNELITNAFKYAFPGDQPRPGEKACEITVSAEWDGDAGDDGVYTLTVADNGVGLPADLDWATTKTLGLRLVRMLGQYQLKGQIELDRANGTSFRLVFASRQREKR
ncbi:MAG: response regulator, partial [Candidatus Aminicenantes bacterium]|nr:response regulator [Candidatus Aminicenantes bacterium]